MNNVVSPTEALTQSLPTRVVAYARTARASPSSHSINRQLTAVTEWVNQNGYTLANTFIDEPSTAPRTDLSAAIAHIENGDADTLAVWDVSRLGRRLQDVAAVLYRVEAAGGHVVSVKDGANTLTGARRSMLALTLGAAR